MSNCRIFLEASKTLLFFLLTKFFKELARIKNKNGSFFCILMDFQFIRYDKNQNHSIIREIEPWIQPCGGEFKYWEPEGFALWFYPQPPWIWWTEGDEIFWNVNRLIDTKGMNRISGKPLKTRGSGTLVVVGIFGLLFDQFENLRQSAEGVFTFEPFPKGIWPPWSEKMNTPYVVLNPVVKKVNPRGHFQSGWKMNPLRSKHPNSLQWLKMYLEKTSF